MTQRLCHVEMKACAVFVTAAVILSYDTSNLLSKGRTAIMSQIPCICSAARGAATWPHGTGHMAQGMPKDYSCDSTLPIEGPGHTAATQDYVAGIVICLYAVANTFSSYANSKTSLHSFSRGPSLYAWCHPAEMPAMSAAATSTFDVPGYRKMPPLTCGV